MLDMIVKVSIQYFAIVLRFCNRHPNTPRTREIPKKCPRTRWSCTSGAHKDLQRAGTCCWKIQIFKEWKARTSKPVYYRDMSSSVRSGCVRAYPQGNAGSRTSIFCKRRRISAVTAGEQRHCCGIISHPSESGPAAPAICTAGWAYRCIHA